MVKLYEISVVMRRAIHDLEIAEANGDPAAYEAAMERLVVLKIDRNEKLSGCCAYYRELEAEAQGVACELARLEGLHKAAKARLEVWKRYMGACLGAGEEWRSDLFRLSWRESKAVQVTDEKAVPELYWREKIVREIDKKAISEDIKTGATIPGAVLEVRQNLQLK